MLSTGFRHWRWDSKRARPSSSLHEKEIIDQVMTTRLKKKISYPWSQQYLSPYNTETRKLRNSNLDSNCFIFFFCKYLLIFYLSLCLHNDFSLVPPLYSDLKNVTANSKFGRIWMECYVTVLCSTEKNRTKLIRVACLWLV